MDEGAGGPTCSALAREMPGAFHGSAVVPGTAGWETLADALLPAQFAAHVRAAEIRWGTDDTVVALSLFVRELTVAATNVAITPFARDRRLLDLSPANVAIRQTDQVATIGLLSTNVAVVDRVEEMAVRLTGGLLDGTVPAIIDAARAHTRIGERHLWGNVALAIVNTLTTIGSHVAPYLRPRVDDDRDTLLAARPELAPTVEVLAVPDGTGDLVTFAIRRTCCLLDQIPGALRCATCSLADRDVSIRQVARYFVAERRAGYGAGR